MAQTAGERAFRYEIEHSKSANDLCCKFILLAIVVVHLVSFVLLLASLVPSVSCHTDLDRPAREDGMRFADKPGCWFDADVAQSQDFRCIKRSRGLCETVDDPIFGWGLTFALLSVPAFGFWGTAIHTCHKRRRPTPTTEHTRPTVRVLQV